MSLSSRTDHVRDPLRASTAEVTAGLDASAVQNIFRLANDRRGLSVRLAELDGEWDIERAMQTSGSALALVGVVLAITWSTSWLLLAAFAIGALLLHALRVWSLPVVLLRQTGVRTRMEIERERYTIKLLRGDFDRAVTSEQRDRAEQAINAVWR